jgi:tRNA-dihydrouridine synthase
MIGRGALADPSLQRSIARELGPLNGQAAPDSPVPWVQALEQFAAICAPFYPEIFVVRRIKQWLSFARKGGSEGGRLFEGTKRLQRLDDILEYVRTSA